MFGKLTFYIYVQDIKSSTIPTYDKVECRHKCILIVVGDFFLLDNK